MLWEYQALWLQALENSISPGVKTAHRNNAGVWVRVIFPFTFFIFDFEVLVKIEGL